MVLRERTQNQTKNKKSSFLRCLVVLIPVMPSACRPVAPPLDSLVLTPHLCICAFTHIVICERDILIHIFESLMSLMAFNDVCASLGKGPIQQGRQRQGSLLSDCYICNFYLDCLYRWSVCVDMRVLGLYEWVFLLRLVLRACGSTSTSTGLAPRCLLLLLLLVAFDSSSVFD